MQDRVLKELLDDPTHSHDVQDPGHNHHTTMLFWSKGGSNLGFVGPGSDNHGSSDWPTSRSKTGIVLDKSTTGIRVATAHCGISMETAGGSAPVENRPPYYALCYIEYRGA